MSELTVEALLAKLRSTFPHWKYFAVTVSIGAPRKKYSLKIGPAFYSADVVNIWGETTGELIAQVRRWASTK